MTTSPDPNRPRGPWDDVPPFSWPVRVLIWIVVVVPVFCTSVSVWLYLTGGDRDSVAFRDGRHIGTWTRASDRRPDLPGEIVFVDARTLEVDGVAYRYELVPVFIEHRLETVAVQGNEELPEYWVSYSRAPLSWFDRMYLGSQAYVR